MRPVKTVDHGAKFQNLSNLMGTRAAGVAENERRLKAEVAAHDGSHGYGRHGAQTGWESQFIRAVTRQTPDQAHDPMGLNPTVRRWNGAISYSHDDGAPVFDLFEDHAAPPGVHATAAGNVAGGFITPEAQMRARARGEAVINRLVGPMYYCAQYRFKDERRFIRAPFTTAEIVVDALTAGGLYGLGFARRDPKSYPHHTRDFVERMIEGFQLKKTWGELLPKVDLNTHKWSRAALKNTIAFPTMDDLADYFDLDILWQPTCKLVYRRSHVAASHSHSPWRLITMFPDNAAPGWAPSLYLTPAMKTALHANGFNRNVDDYHWTGRTGSHDNAVKTRNPVPPWAT